MKKVTNDLKSVKVMFLVFCCAALWREKMTGMELAACAGVVIVARTINEKRFEATEKDSA